MRIARLDLRHAMHPWERWVYSARENRRVAARKVAEWREIVTEGGADGSAASSLTTGGKWPLAGWRTG